MYYQSYILRKGNLNLLKTKRSTVDSYGKKTVCQVTALTHVTQCVPLKKRYPVSRKSPPHLKYPVSSIRLISRILITPNRASLLPFANLVASIIRDNLYFNLVPSFPGLSSLPPFQVVVEEKAPGSSWSSTGISQLG